MQQPNNVTSQPDNVPRVAIIVAMTKGRVIGSGDALPWHLPEDLQLFKYLTMGGTVIMGRKTYASIGRPLPGRHNIVLSRSRRELPGVQVCDSFMEGLTAAAHQGRTVFIIGGEEIYRMALPIASELYISWIKEDVSGDKFFPKINFADWIPCEGQVYQGFRYVHYRRYNLCYQPKILP